MIKSPSKYLSREFLRGLKNSYYLSKSGLEYCPFEVDYLLAEKETRLAVVEYNEQLHKSAQQHSNSGIIKGFPPIVSSNNAPKLFRADTIFPLKEVQNRCFYGTETTASIDPVAAPRGPVKNSTDQKQQQAGSDKLPALRQEKKLKFSYKNHVTVKVLHEDYSLAAIRRDLKTSNDQLARINNVMRSANAKTSRANRATVSSR